MYQYNWVNMDSFGDNLPDNWVEIATRLNAIYEKMGIPEYGELTHDERDISANIWESYCAGNLEQYANH